ncbi:MAG: hypothetical protein R3B53_01905 [Candidatus Paceibacterota bacterium]
MVDNTNDTNGQNLAIHAGVMPVIDFDSEKNGGDLYLSAGLRERN